jgi:hypothetical protein
MTRRRAPKKVSFPGCKRVASGVEVLTAAAPCCASASAPPLEPPSKKAKVLKNPAVDTSFLPDRERDTRERQEREELRRKWLKDQETLKNEDVEITYSYWDGAGHRRVVKCKKGDDIAVFLEKCRQQFPELRGTSVDNLMYIKEDLIIPHVRPVVPFAASSIISCSGS